MSLDKHYICRALQCNCTWSLTLTAQSSRPSSLDTFCFPVYVCPGCKKLHGDSAQESAIFCKARRLDSDLACHYFWQILGKKVQDAQFLPPRTVVRILQDHCPCRHCLHPRLRFQCRGETNSGQTPNSGQLAVHSPAQV